MKYFYLLFGLLILDVGQAKSLEPFLRLKNGQVLFGVEEDQKNFSPPEPLTPNNFQRFSTTPLPDLKSVTAMFHRLDKNYQRKSECYNRAHVWSFDEAKNFGVETKKVFIFFTAAYIRRVRFNWWFHVAPLVQFREENGDLGERVLDFRFADRPLTVKQWTDLFVYSSRPCKKTTKFSEYDVNPQTEDCYLITTSMYYWQPQDIAARDAGAPEKQGFDEGSFEAARSEAF